MHIDYKVATLAHLALINKFPRYIQDLVKQHIPARDLRSSRTGPLLLAPRTKLSISEKAFSSALPVTIGEVYRHTTFWRNNWKLSSFPTAIRPRLKYPAALYPFVVLFSNAAKWRTESWRWTNKCVYDYDLRLRLVASHLPWGITDDNSLMILMMMM